MILDTTFIIDVMRNDSKALEKLNYLIKKGETQLITSLTVFELFSGASRSKRITEEKNKIVDILKGQLIINFDSDAAQKAGEIDGTLIKEGKMIDIIDSMIGGIAIIRKEKMLTKNIKDFSKIRGIEIETY